MRVADHLLAVPAYALVNLDLHYDPPRGDAWWSRLRLYLPVQKMFGRIYVGSAGIGADGIVAGTGLPTGVVAPRGTTGSIYAGQPRTVYAGVTSRF